jgi:hypothetical protein
MTCAVFGSPRGLVSSSPTLFVRLGAGVITHFRMSDH